MHVSIYIYKTYNTWIIIRDFHHFIHKINLGNIKHYWRQVTVLRIIANFFLKYHEIISDSYYVALFIFFHCNIGDCTLYFFVHVTLHGTVQCSLYLSLTIVMLNNYIAVFNTTNTQNIYYSSSAIVKNF